MKLQIKKTIFYLSISLLLLGTGIGFSYHIWKINHTLTIGIYTGSMWNMSDNHQYQVIDYAIKEFKKIHPDIQINYENGISKADYRNWLSEKIVQGNSPDLMIVPDDSFNLLANNGEFKDLAGYMNRDKISDKIFYPVALKAGELNNEQYALPFQTNPQFMVMNKKVLLRNNIKIPSFNWTPSDLKRICLSLSNSKKKNSDLGITSNYTWSNAILGYNFKFNQNKDNPIQLTSPSAIKGFNLIESLKAIEQTNKNNSRQAFDKGKVAFTPMTLAQYRTYTSYPYYVTTNNKNITWNCLKMPQIFQAKATHVDVAMFAIAKQAHNPNLAWKLLKMLCINKKIQQKAMTVNKGCSALPSVVLNPKMQRVLNNDKQSNLTTTKLDKIMRNGWSTPKFKNFNDVYSYLDYAINKALANDQLDKQIFYIQQQANEELIN
ncbi:ABC transporter substrate-binding protein [Lactobacillus ultunensis]|uniref:ABC transporter, solute-binding protein n=1 Tax=Lactobacillus ultunensis DSM 16047 TaxID=525365 RepID=C2ER67_9LACO|nr:extracellular solute-binding protein [Lactobacillus ultunensis]EEJ70956.1 ABC transporter, solute-binding protein [Lactobacillus ultunensis DSM 16047]KRL80879.1 sugar-binding protein [Lactobacillus ultunensis DSM 16047]